MPDVAVILGNGAVGGEHPGFGNVHQALAPPAHGYLMDCMRDFAADGKAAGAKWYTAGPLLKSGQPHHPLYLKKDTQLLDFDIDAYLCAQRAK